MKNPFERTIDKNNTHRFDSVRETKVRERLTVFAWSVFWCRRITSREEEDTTVDCHHESQEGDDLKSVDLSLIEGIYL